MYVAVGAAFVLSALFIYSAEGDLLYVLFICPIVFISCLALLVASAVRKRLRETLSMTVTLIVFLLISGALLTEEAAIRPRLRWMLLSRHYKAEIMAQPAFASGEFRHIEWDGWGGAPVGDWTAYVVFDPTDSLSTLAGKRLSGKLAGVPCDVDSVRRLERQWYSVTLSVNEWWGRCRD